MTCLYSNYNTHKKGYDTKPRLFAIGDINGDIKALQDIMLKIERHPLALNDTIVFVGNLVGKGKGSRDVLSFVRNLHKKYTTNKIVILRGQNDHKLLLSKKTYETSEDGRNVIDSFINPKTNKLDIRELCLARKYIHSLPCMYETTKLVFTSSAIDISKPTKQQDIGFLMFRDPSFMYQIDINFPKRVVHGNYPQKTIAIKKNLINLDSSKDNKLLSCVVFDSKSENPIDTIVTDRSA